MHYRWDYGGEWIFEDLGKTAAIGGGELLQDDDIPASLLPLLTRQMSEQAPVVADTVRDFQEWSELSPVAPRSSGFWARMHS